MTETREYNIGICGIGGQGNIVAARIFANAAMENGLNVRIGELYGSAQRGGPVISHLRIGEVFSPLIPRGRANTILSLEQSEILRYAHLLSPRALALVNQYQIPPIDVKLGKAKYPTVEEIKEALAPITRNVKFANGTEEATKFGNPRVVNVLMLGVLTGTESLPVSDASFETSIENYFPTKLRQINLEAFHHGKELATSL